jgi:hypothetical protein
MKAEIKAEQEKMKDLLTRLKTMKDATQNKMEPGPEHREIPKEETAVKSSETMKKRHRSRHLAAGCLGKRKELTRGDCGTRRKLAAACRKVSCGARGEWRKRDIIRNKWTRAKVGRGIRRVGTLRKKLQMRHEGRRVMKGIGSRRSPF